MSAQRWLCAVGGIVLAGCAGPLDRPGWTCSKDVMCHPVDGRWLGFRVGMSKVDAIAAGCSAVLAKQVKESPTYFAISHGRCVVQERVADMSGKWAVWDGWSFRPDRTERHCYGPEGENVAIDFDRATGKVTRISAYCAVTLP